MRTATRDVEVRCDGLSTERVEAVDHDETFGLVATLQGAKLEPAEEHVISDDGDATNQVVLLRVSRRWNPPSPRAVPFPGTFAMPHAVANALVLELNAVQLDRGFPGGHWYLLTGAKKRGYYVLRVIPPDGWRPLREHDLPPGATPTDKRAAHDAAREFNEAAMALAEHPQWWAIVARRPDPPPLSGRTVRGRLMNAYGGKCAYCGKWLRPATATIDHVRPKSKGGSRRGVGNQVLCCADCNRLKGDRSPAEWAEDILSGAEQTLSRAERQDRLLEAYHARLVRRLFGHSPSCDLCRKVMTLRGRPEDRPALVDRPIGPVLICAECDNGGLPVEEGGAA